MAIDPTLINPYVTTEYPNNWYRTNVISTVVEENTTVTFFVPRMVNFHPITLALSSVTGLTVKYSCSTAPEVQEGTANWYTQSGLSAGLNVINYQITAIRLIATSTVVTAELAG